MPYSRRDLGKMAIAGLAMPGLFNSRLMADTRFGGVTIGLQTYSLRSISDPNAILAAIKSLGFSAIELMSNHAEAMAGAPSGRGDAAALGAWRTAATDATWKTVRQKVADTGAELRFLTYNMNVNRTTDEEVDYAFRMAKALGVKGITSSTQISMARRLVPFVDKYQIPFAFHGHASVNDPDETSTEATFEAALAVHKLFMANLDIGHYIVAGGDPVAFINKHHARITNLHLKDRTKAVAADAARGIQGRPAGNVPFGQGETPIKDVLQLLKKTKWEITPNIEFEYPGDPLVELPKCIEYCRNALV